MAHSSQAVLGIDVGTTAVKAMLLHANGAVLAEAEVEQPISVPRPGWTEQHPDMWWRNTVLAVRKALQLADQGGRHIELAAIGLSGQMHSSVFLDCRWRSHQACLAMERRPHHSTAPSHHQCFGLAGRFKARSANLPLEGFTAPKLLWLKQNEPDNYARLRALLLPKDYIRYRLSGDYATEPSDAAGTLLFDIRHRRWSQPMLQALEVDVGILPRVVESTEISGVVTTSRRFRTRNPLRVSLSLAVARTTPPALWAAARQIAA